MSCAAQCLPGCDGELKWADPGVGSLEGTIVCTKCGREFRGIKDVGEQHREARETKRMSKTDEEVTRVVPRKIAVFREESRPQWKDATLLYAFPDGSALITDDQESTARWQAGEWASMMRAQSGHWKETSYRKLTDDEKVYLAAVTPGFVIRTNPTGPWRLPGHVGAGQWVHWAVAAAPAKGPTGAAFTFEMGEDKRFCEVSV